MKNSTILISAIVSLFLFASCDKGELGPVMSTNPNAPSITAPQDGKSYMLTEEQAKDTLLTMQWDEPDYGYSAAPQYAVQMGSPGEDFTSPINLATVNKTSYSVIVEDMNNRLLSAGLAPGQQSNMEFRVIASISDSLQQQVSSAISLQFTPYEVIIIYPSVYVPGSYQSASGYTTDWSPADAPALESVNSDDTYEGYVYMKNSENQFKITAEQNWTDGDWGDTGTDGSLDAGGDNILAPDAGYYKINVDLNSMTYTILNTDWGLIGSATVNGWDSDQDMTYDPKAKIWTITTDLTAGEIKFRANDAWDLSYGDTDGDFNLDAGGDNIAVDEAGNYTIELKLSKAPYSYTIIKN